MVKNKKIQVQGTEITITSGQLDDYISLTDIARYKDTTNTDDIIKAGYGIEMPLNCRGSGKPFTIAVLNPSNSRGLENKPG